MKAPRVVIIAIAAVAALLLGLVFKVVLSGKTSQPAEATQVKVAPKIAIVRVLVAARELKAGTRLNNDDLSWVEWPATASSPAYHIKSEDDIANAAKAITKVDSAKPISGVVDATQKMAKAGTSVLEPDAQIAAFVGAVVRETIRANEPIIDAKVVKASQGGFMAVMLEPGERALSVPVSVETTAGGFILPGDHVDIIVSQDAPRPANGGYGGGTTKVALTVLKNIRVLAIDQSVQPRKDQPALAGATATLALNPEQGRLLAQAKAQGPLSLMLRSYADVEARPGDDVAADTQSTQSVKVFRGADVTEVPVSR